jgi:hypothetical protein
VTVRVINGTARAAAPEGRRVRLLLMLGHRGERSRQRELTAVTDAAGAARFTIAGDVVSAQPLVGLATVDYRGLAFPSEPFRITGREPAVSVPLLVYETPRARLPAWSYVALGAIFVLSLALVLFRRSDRQLPA